MSSPTHRAGGARTVLTGAALLSATMLAVSAVNYLLNFVLARLLEPAEFGDATLAISLVLSAAVVAAALQLVASKSVASDPASIEAVRRALVRAALVVGALVVAVLGGGAWLIADALSVSDPWMLVIIALGLPVYFVQAVHRGALQGQLRFGRLATTYAAEAAVRGLVVIGLVAAGAGVIGASIGIALSFIASALIARGGAEDDSGAPTAARGVLRGAVVGAIVMLIGQTLLNNADLVIAKAVLDAPSAGRYAAAAVLGRSVFFVSWSVVQVVFPVIASTSSTAAQRRRAIVIATAVIVGVGAGGGGGSAAAGLELMRLLFGDAYASASALLVGYVIATTLFAIAALAAAIDLARDRIAAPLVLAVGAVAQTSALVLWARTPEALVHLQVIGTAAILVAMAVLGMWRGRRRRAGSPSSTVDIKL